MSISVIGYGTFITRGYWKNKKNVEVCLIPNFVRILPKNNWFPYILASNNSSFWALKFDVNENELKELDHYEGVDMGLFKRSKIEVMLKNKTLSEAFIYLPTKSTIDSQNLNFKMDMHDKWKEKIKQFPEIVAKFPELVL